MTEPIQTIGKKKLPVAEFVFIIALFFIYLLPEVDLGSTIMLMLLIAYSGYLVLMDNRMIPAVVIVMSLIVILSIWYAVLTDTSSISQQLSNRQFLRFVSKMYQYTMLYFPALLFIRVYYAATQKQKQILAILGVALVAYVIVVTWLFLVENPDATREWENFEENSEQGVANYYFIYAIPIVLSVVSIFWSKYKGIVRWVSIAVVITGIVFLVNAQYTLSILIAVIGVLIQLFRNVRSTVGKLLFILTMVVVAFMLPDILEFFIQKIESDQVTERLTEIHAFLTGSGAGGYNLNGRLTLYGKTIKAFFESPVWGNADLDFDGHATFLTVLSDLGLLGGLPFYALLVYVCKQIKHLLVGRAQFNVIITMFVMMGLTNPIHASMPLGFVTWFLAPLVIHLIFKEDSQNEKPLED